MSTESILKHILDENLIDAQKEINSLLMIKVGDALQQFKEDYVPFVYSESLGVAGIAEAKKKAKVTDKEDDGEGMDAVQPKAVKKKFKDRKDKDIDNDGDVDDSDEYLHKRRQTVSKAIKKETKKENFEVGTKARTDHTLSVTPGQSPEEFDQQVNVMHKKKNSMREALAKMWGIKEGQNPFDKKEQKKYNKDKKEGKTLTGKAETKVEVEPKMEKKK